MRQTSAEVAFNELLKAHWENRLQENPLAATRSGDHRFQRPITKRLGRGLQIEELKSKKSFLSSCEQIDAAELSDDRAVEQANV